MDAKLIKGKFTREQEKLLRMGKMMSSIEEEVRQISDIAGDVMTEIRIGIDIVDMTLGNNRSYLSFNINDGSFYGTIVAHETIEGDVFTHENFKDPEVKQFIKRSILLAKDPKHGCGGCYGCSPD